MIIKLAALRESLDEMINTYYEKIRVFALLYDLNRNADPCIFFRSYSDSGAIRDVFAEGISLCEFRDKLEDEIENRVHKLMPNTASLIGDKLSTELLVKAKSMKRLVSYPSSSIQLLGAEKALFLHIEKGKKPPKYGVIFKYPGLASLRPSMRGKIARMIANKVAIAIRADYFSSTVDTQKFKKIIDEAIQSRKK